MFSNSLALEERVKENVYHLLDTGGNTSSSGKREEVFEIPQEVFERHGV